MRSDEDLGAIRARLGLDSPELEQSPTDLVSRLEEYRANAGSAYLYWVGTQRGCPVPEVDVHGIVFRQDTDLLERDDYGKTRRSRQFGCLVLVSAMDVARMRRRLPLLVLRYHNIGGNPMRDESGTGRNTGMDHRPAGRGTVLQIPDPLVVAERRKNGFPPPPPYAYKAGDISAATMLYAQLCEDQAHPRTGLRMPPPLSETNFADFPDPIPDLAAIEAAERRQREALEKQLS